MKIAVSKLVPNPWRRMESYPIDRDKVRSLKISIEDTTFWDNLLVRRSKRRRGYYEIAYGHHRLIALKELKVREVDLPVRKLTEAQMIKIMANENLDEWRTMPKVYNETIFVAKDFLDAVLKKYDTWEEFRLAKNVQPIFDSEPEFRSVKGKKKGIGWQTIQKFLGKNWHKWIIQDALNTRKGVEDGTLDREAVEVFDKAEHAKIFKKAVRENKIPKSEQRLVAQTIQNDLTDKRIKRTEIEESVHKSAPAAIKKERAKLKLVKPKPVPDIEEWMSDLLDKMADVLTDYDRVKGHLEHIDPVFTLPSFEERLERMIEASTDILRRLNHGDSKGETTRRRA
jgi:hypothetical protein